MISGLQRPSQKRYGQIDMLRGLGIGCVVSAHVLVHEQAFNSMFVKLVYIFHMPLFFFLSGYLSSVRTQYRAFFAEKFKQLIIPYLIYLIVIYSIHELTGKPGLGIRSLALGGNYLHGYLGVFWFVPCLFLTQQVANYMIAKFSLVINLLIVTVCLIISYANDLYFENMKFPYNINVVFAAIPFYFSGNLFKNYNVKWLFLVALIIAILGAGATMLGYPNYYNMKIAYYGFPGATLLSGLAVIVILLIIFLKLPSWNVVAYLGQASLVIMYLHQAIQLILFENGIDNAAIRVTAAIFIPIFVFYLANQWSVSRALLLGSRRDLDDLQLRLQGAYSARSGN
jgi:fucose 4-O-acetylase-like acetyltransferase